MLNTLMALNILDITIIDLTLSTLNILDITITDLTLSIK